MPDATHDARGRRFRHTAETRRKISDIRRGQSIAGTPWYDWATVNWSWSNAAIARSLECTIQAVLQRRLERGESPRGRKASRVGTVIADALGQTEEERQLARESIVRRLIRTDATMESLSHEYGLAIGTIYRIYAMATTPEMRRAVKRRKISDARKLMFAVKEGRAAGRASGLAALRGDERSHSQGNV
jgi:Trp operon repressor